MLSFCLASTVRADNLGYSKYHPLIIGLDLDYAPLQYVDDDGIPKGYDVEFTQVLMDRLNIPYTYSPNTWENISGDVLKGRVELAMMVYSPYRKDIINYSRAVFRLYYQILYRKDTEEKFDVRNLSGKSIAFMSSRPVTDTLSKAGAILNVVNDLSKATIDLSKGKYDAIICFRHQSKFLIEQNRLTNIETENLTLMPREYCYVSHNKQLIEAINSELEKMEKDGTINDIYGGDITSQFGGLEIPEWIWYLIGSLIIAALTGFIFIQRLHQRKLRIEMERALRSERMKTIFLGNISHALRTPLNAIIGFSDVMRDAPPGTISHDDQQEILSRINDNGQQLLYFINELLQLSNIQGNEMQFNRTEIDVKQTLEEFCALIRQEVKPGVKVVVNSHYMTCHAVLDINLMQQVTMHMLKNAAMHTSEGNITVSYRAENKGLRVSIKDTGTGLPKELKDNIFGLLNDQNTFVQSENPGLGLSICKAIIDKCKGKIGAQSETGYGSTFWYWVPCKIRTT